MLVSKELKQNKKETNSDVDIKTCLLLQQSSKSWVPRQL